MKETEIERRVREQREADARAGKRQLCDRCCYVHNIGDPCCQGRKTAAGHWDPWV